MIKFGSRAFATSFLVLGVIGLPLYTFESGGVQLAHICFGAFFLLFVAKRSFGRSRTDLTLFAFLMIVVLRESIAVLTGHSVLSLLNVMYVAFGFMMVNCVSRSVADWDARSVRAAAFLSVTAAVAGVLALGEGALHESEGDLVRAVGTFNNPNQLGYFAVCMASIAGAYRLADRLGGVALAVTLAMCIFMAVASLSKAAMLAVSIPALMFGFMAAKGRVQVVLGFAVLVAVAAGSFWAYQSGALDGYRFVARLEGIGRQSDDSFAGRGYGVMEKASAIEFLFGMGSEKVRSFLGHEVHSTVYSVFASYGVVGAGVFTMALLSWIARVYRAFGMRGIGIVALPAMAYGISHNGGRFAAFWLLVSISIGCAALALRSQTTASPRADRVRGARRQPIPASGHESWE